MQKRLYPEHKPRPNSSKNILKICKLKHDTTRFICQFFVYFLERYTQYPNQICKNLRQRGMRDELRRGMNCLMKAICEVSCKQVKFKILIFAEELSYQKDLFRTTITNIENTKLSKFPVALALTCKTEHQRDNYNTCLTCKYTHCWELKSPFLLNKQSENLYKRPEIPNRLQVYR